MNEGEFCFINTVYYNDHYANDLSEPQKQHSNGIITKRPFLCVAIDAHNPNIMWVAPLTSQVGHYDHTRNTFVELVPLQPTQTKSIVLIQNMMPITAQYIDSAPCKINNFNPNSISNAIQMSRDILNSKWTEVNMNPATTYTINEACDFRKRFAESLQNKGTEVVPLPTIKPKAKKPALVISKKSSFQELCQEEFGSKPIEVKKAEPAKPPLIEKQHQKAPEMH